MSSAVAVGGVFLLAMLAPFEMTVPLVTLPGQSVTNLEAAMLLSCAAWAAAVLWSGEWPRRPIPLAWPWLAFVAAMAIAAIAAPAQRTNALHMVGRFAAAGAVYVLVVAGATTTARLRTAMAIVVATGAVVAVLAILEYAQVRPVLDLLRLFRPSVTAVGAQVRAGGSLLYPTIASMYLEVVFAIGLGLMLAAIDDSALAQATAWFVALGLAGAAITLTFTRAGLITMAISLLAVGGWRIRQRGFERGAAAIASLAVVVGLLFLSSRPAQSVWLRLTSEGQDTWYQARVEAPATVDLRAAEERTVPITLTNTGRVAWDSTDPAPIVLSYHWMDPQSGRVVSYEGLRTPFVSPVLPGATVTIDAAVKAPHRAGRYRLEWDLVQEGRLWFSTEQDAPDPVASLATVVGGMSDTPLTTRPRPVRVVRPGRFLLWSAALRMIAAHPALGVGPDNFRLLYGSYAGLTGADPRTHSNNMYLEVLAGGGVVAFAAFAWFLFKAAPLCCATPALAAAGAAIAVHGLVDSFVSFAPTYILFALTLGFAAAMARGVESPADAHRV